MMQAVVLGAGMVGSVMAADLAADPAFVVTVADFSDANLAAASKKCGGRARTIREDLSNAATIKRIIAEADIVLGALSSRIAFSALRTILESGKNFCDISFMAEDPLELDSLAKSKGVMAVVDCGVAPGMSHLLAGYAAAQLSPCENIEIYVGGLPRERRWPFEYKAAFSPADVIEEYTRPSRLVEHGKEVVREALSEPELMNFPGAGTLEAFNTDGLRSLVKTLKVPFMKEKTLRYPGHIELMRVFRETGYFSEEPIRVGGVEVRPRDLTAKLLFPKWTYGPGEEDLTVMRVLGDGIKNGTRQRMVWDLFDLYHGPSQSTSMARTTAFPCAIVARMITSGKLKKPGVLTPELLATEPGLVDHVLAEHARRGVRYEFRTESLVK
jgi:saccharopine dehydrogenase-like NADP-dependent oxidoreductase